MQQKLEPTEGSDSDICRNKLYPTFSQAWWNDTGHESLSKVMAGEVKMNYFVPRHLEASYGNLTSNSQATTFLDEEKDASKVKGNFSCFLSFLILFLLSVDMEL